MSLRFGRRTVFVIALLLCVGCWFADAQAQRKRNKKSRRVTNPVSTSAAQPAPTPQTNEPRIISTADENLTDPDSGATTGNNRRTRNRRSTASQAAEENPQSKVDRLSEQVTALQEKLSLMEQQQRTLVDLERLSRAEQRGETLRAQLRDVQEKESDLQGRAEQLDYELQPSVIERTLAVTGSTRPEELRELRRQQLQSEKNRVQTQLGQLGASRARLEAAIANADTEAERIRARVEAADQPATDNDATTSAPAIVTQPATTDDANDSQP